MDDNTRLNQRLLTDNQELARLTETLPGLRKEALRLAEEISFTTTALGLKEASLTRLDVREGALATKEDELTERERLIVHREEVVAAREQNVTERENRTEVPSTPLYVQLRTLQRKLDTKGIKFDVVKELQS